MYDQHERDPTVSAPAADCNKTKANHILSYVRYLSFSLEYKERVNCLTTYYLFLQEELFSMQTFPQPLDLNRCKSFESFAHISDVRYAAQKRRKVFLKIRGILKRTMIQWFKGDHPIDYIEKGETEESEYGSEIVRLFTLMKQ